MKTAVSIPTEVFVDAERLAKQLQTSRSRLYAMALAEFIARHDHAHATEMMNIALDEIDHQADSFVNKANRVVFESNEW